MRVILLSGKANSGKNTVSTSIKKQLQANNKSVLEIAYADMVKYMCKSYLGWNGEKDELGRTMLQTFGTDIVRKEYNKPNYWVDRVIDVINFTSNYYDYYLVTDCRFPNEIELPKGEFADAISINVVREGDFSVLTEEQKNHISETALDGFHYDFIFYNNSDLESLDSKVKKLLIDLGEIIC